MMVKRRMTMKSKGFENIDEVLTYKASLKKKVKRKEKKFKKTIQLVRNDRNSSNKPRRRNGARRWKRHSTRNSTASTR